MTDPAAPSAPPERPRFESPPLGFGDQQQLQQVEQKNNKVLWGIFGLLLVLTLGVVFLLPSLVQPVAPPVPVVLTPTEATAVAEPAPFEAAQRLRIRQQAQEVLDPLLDLQGQLEKQQVQAWAADAFAAALATAKQGDEAYGAQRYEQALAAYQQGLQALQAIAAQSGTVLAEKLAAGQAALAAGDSTTATATFEIALLLDPGNGEAMDGLGKSRVLDQVLALLSAGQQLEEAGSLEEARSKFEEAQRLDAGNAVAAQALARIATARANANFAAVMSRGFAALQAGDPDGASQAFEQAAALRPGSAEVSAALQQAKDQKTLSAITVHLAAAAAAEAAESWAAALAEWRAALVIDPNLVSAEEGERRTQSRSNLDDFLVATLANPLRLGDPAVHAQTVQVVQDARNLLVPGPRLQQQLEQVDSLLTRAQVPIRVTLLSDGQTQVTLQGVGALGLISAHSLDLLPGTYVAIGVRQGFRDVRQEFTVGLDGQPVQLTVACTESI
jgi:tetratricopeptide (TPR) repeat protein